MQSTTQRQFEVQETMARILFGWVLTLENQTSLWNVPPTYTLTHTHTHTWGTTLCPPNLLFHYVSFSQWLRVTERRKQWKSPSNCPSNYPSRTLGVILHTSLLCTPTSNLSACPINSISQIFLRFIHFYHYCRTPVWATLSCLMYHNTLHTSLLASSLASFVHSHTLLKEIFLTVIIKIFCLQLSYRNCKRYIYPLIHC